MGLGGIALSAGKPLLLVLQTKNPIFKRRRGTSAAVPMSDNRSSTERNIALLDIEFESRVWHQAAQVHGEDLAMIIAQGLASYRRQPGLDSPVWLHRSVVGERAVFALSRAMDGQGANSVRTGPSYVEVRSRMGDHLRRHLQWSSMQAGSFTEDVAENFLAGELGL